FSLLLFTRPRPPIPTLFPYTTLFRSHLLPRRRAGRYPLPRGGEGVRRSRRAVLQREHARRPRARGGAIPATRMISIIGLKNAGRSEEHTSELQSRFDLVCRLLLEKKK